MNSLERFHSAMNREVCDRVLVKHEGTPEVNQELMTHFGLSNMEQLLRVLGDDFRYVDPVYVGPELKEFPDGSVEGYWGERYKYIEFDGGRYLEASYMPFAEVHSMDELDTSRFPTAELFDYSTIAAQCAKLREQGLVICFGTAGDMDFINSIARARGMEQVLMDLITDDPVYAAIMDARFQFYYDMHERVLQEGNGMVDVMHIGEDLGNQRGPMISMDVFDRHFAEKFQKYFDMVHSYGARSMMHMCGCVEPFLDRLIDLGLDIMDVVQPTTPEMDIAYLQEHYGDRLTFCGSVCVQSTLPHGTVEDVENEIQRRLDLFPQGGLILGPTHAVQVGTPIENTLAMYRQAGSLSETLDRSIMDIHTEVDEGKVNMSKLY